MPDNDILTDDYVAGLLAKEASDCSIKYSAMGLEAFETNKKPNNMPKPNTRFLRHIIKDTDTHNKALLAKEAAESRARLKDLERTEDAKRRKANPHARDVRKRQMGDIQAILGSKPRKRREAEGEDSIEDRGTERREAKHRAHDKSSGRDKDLFRERRREDRRDHGRLNREERGREDGDEDEDDRSRRRERKKSRRAQERSSSPEKYDKYGKTKSRRERSRSPDRERRSQSPREKKNKHRQRSRHRSPRNAKTASKSSSKRLFNENDNDKDDDSDPLDDLIGPVPPPTYRGRGKATGSAGIDRRFSESYDPTADVDMDEDTGGPSDEAAEAMRDRLRLRHAQEERMRAAGFDDELIRKAAGKMGGLVEGRGEGEVESVRWAKAGEKREWDLDKK